MTALFIYCHYPLRLILGQIVYIHGFFNNFIYILINTFIFIPTINHTVAPTFIFNSIYILLLLCYNFIYLIFIKPQKKSGDFLKTKISG